jgi:hypothetical protein
VTQVVAAHLLHDGRARPPPPGSCSAICSATAMSRSTTTLGPNGAAFPARPSKFPETQPKHNQKRRYRNASSSISISPHPRGGTDEEADSDEEIYDLKGPR